MAITLKAARVNANITQQAAAEAIGISQTTLSNWERGATEPSVSEAKKLCELYAVSLDDVIFLPSKTN